MKLPIIDKGIPAPTTKGRAVGVGSKYGFHRMEVGDSFVVENKNVISAASWFGKRNNQEFIVRKINGSYRVWRTK
jgi:hypothetical protein